jgi:hypothetical protein
MPHARVEWVHLIKWNSKTLCNQWVYPTTIVEQYHPHVKCKIGIKVLKSQKYRNSICPYTFIKGNGNLLNEQQAGENIIA